jgi:hypothetical protein
VLTLANDSLRLEIIDPATDTPLLGSRYCHGGYIWQAYDQVAGSLFTGPQWPKPAPQPFNGQGVPESFRHRTRGGAPLTWRGDRGVGIGIGELAASSSGEVTIVDPCRWEITSSNHALKFTTAQRTDPFHYELQRSVQLDGRTLLSSSELTNHGQEPLVLEWFPHPFFALSDGCIQMETPAGTRMKENPGFVLLDRSFSQRRKFLHEMDGHLDFLELPPAAAYRFRVNHPKLTHVDFTFDFAPSECLVWGNDATFSVEPYLALALAPGETRRWNLRYDFGAVARITSPGDNARVPARV